MKIVITAIGTGDNLKGFGATAFASALLLSLGVALSGCGYIYRTLPDGYYPVSTETKIRPTDKYGNVLLYKDYWTVEEGGTIVSTDKFGNKRHDKPQYVIREDRVYETSYGRIQYHKPSWIVEKDGRVVQVDPYGNKQLHKQQYKVVDGKVYETDAYGRLRRQKFEIKNEQGSSK